MKTEIRDHQEHGMKSRNQSATIGTVALPVPIEDQYQEPTVDGNAITLFARMRRTDMALAITSICLVTIGIIMWFSGKAPFIAYLIGVSVGITFLLLVIRKIGQKCPKSSVCSEIFYGLTKHKAAIYNIPHPATKETIQVKTYGDSHEYANLMDILKSQMKFSPSIAKEAAKYAMENAKDKPLQDKIKEALKYIDSENNVAKGA